MVRSSYQVAAGTSASPAQIWSLLMNAYSWPRWGTVDALLPEQSEQISPDGHDGVGAVRAFRTGRVVTREKIVELYEHQRLVYVGVDNPFMNNSGGDRADRRCARRIDNRVARHLSRGIRPTPRVSPHADPDHAADGQRPSTSRCPAEFVAACGHTRRSGAIAVSLRTTRVGIVAAALSCLIDSSGGQSCGHLRRDR